MEAKDFFKADSPRYYPKITISLIQNPNRLYAIPLLGLLIKVIVLLPVIIWLIILSIMLLPVTIINSLVVLVSGKYWQPAFELGSGIIRLTIKIYFYFFGLTDKYPGFSFTINDNYSIEIPSPQTPNRLYAIPFLGWLIRLVLAIPYILFSEILSAASYIAAIVAAIVVLVAGKYPESSFELVRDSNRVNLASLIYFLGLSDTYPSFYISLNHQLKKIIYLTLGLLSLISNYFSSNFSSGK